MDSTERSLRQHLAELEERVSRLEREPDEARPAPVRPPTHAPTPDDGRDQFWALSGLQSRLADHPATADGVAMIVGSLTLPSGAPVAWQEGAATAGMLETEWTDHAATFAALGHPVRLELLRHILSGVHATAELAQVASLGTTGQLHHHLRQLVAVGWVRQSARGSYEVPAARIVPLLASLVAAQR